jgi:hypothetical protein
MRWLAATSVRVMWGLLLCGAILLLATSIAVTICLLYLRRMF